MTILSTRVLSSEESSTVKIADKAKALIESGKKVIDFSAGRAFEGTPAYVLEAAIKAMRNGDTHQTRAKGTTGYRRACSFKLARENNIDANPETEIVATMGCKQGLTISLLALLNPGDEVIIEDPGFVSYKPTIEYLGGQAVTVPLLKENNFRWRKEQLLAAVTTKTKAIIFCSPHNPTGVVHSREDLEEIADVARMHNIIVIADETYERTTWNSRTHQSITTLPGMADLTITLFTLTKSFSMGGWRVGFAYANPAIIEQMTKLQQHLITCVNSFVQAGGIAAFGQPPKLEVLKYWREWEEKVKYITSVINKIDGLRCDLAEGGFYAWVNISALNISSIDFSERLLANDYVAVVPGAAFGEMGKDYIRITCVRSWDDIKEGLLKIKDFVHHSREKLNA